MARTTSLVSVILGSVLALAAAGGEAQIVTTVAGSGAWGYLDGTGSKAAFNYPQGIAVDSRGNVYVADTLNVRIRKISSGGVVTTFAGSGKKEYNYPDVPVAAASFFGPLGVAVDAAGIVWVADQDDGIDGQWMLKITTDGILHNVSLYQGGGGLPLAVASSGLDLYVLDWDKLWRVPANGKAAVLASNLQLASAIAVDASGTVYVADTLRNTILKVTAEGVVTTLAGSGSPGHADGAAKDASFNGPAGIAVDPKGHVYVADTGNNTIRGISADGVVTTLAGSGTAGNADGFGSGASFNRPRGLALSPDGDLYVADSFNNKIRRIALGAGCIANCTDWTVPSVARTAGPNGSFWTSSLTIHNRGSAPATLTLKFLGHDADGSSGPEQNVTLGPSQTSTYADVLASVFGLSDGYGALQVRTAFDVIVRSRTSTISGGGTIGDGIPGVRFDRLVTDQTSPPAVLTGLREDSVFRTNLVLVNGSASPVDVIVTALDSSGAPLGTKTRALRPYEMTQDAHFLAGAEFGVGPKTDVTVAVSTTTPGAAYTACAIVIDNASNAPTAVLPQ